MWSPWCKPSDGLRTLEISTEIDEFPVAYDVCHESKPSCVAWGRRRSDRSKTFDSRSMFCLRTMVKTVFNQWLQKMENDERKYLGKCVGEIRFGIAYFDRPRSERKTIKNKQSPTCLVARVFIVTNGGDFTKQKTIAVRWPRHVRFHLTNRPTFLSVSRIPSEIAADV